jgi:hypothetical protein
VSREIPENFSPLVSPNHFCSAISALAPPRDDQLPGFVLNYAIPLPAASPEDHIQKFHFGI